METKSNNLLVGTVTLALLAAILLAGMLLSGMEKKGDHYDIFFKSSVSGLSSGSAVMFNGVPVGSVEEVELWKPDPRWVRVEIEVDKNVKITDRTVASVASSFTGPSAVQLRVVADDAKWPMIDVKVVENGETKIRSRKLSVNDFPTGKNPKIIAAPGGLDDIIGAARQVMNETEDLTVQLQKLVSDENQESFSKILANTEQMTAQMTATARRYGNLSSDVGNTLGAAQAALANIDMAADRYAALAEKSSNLLDEQGQELVSEVQEMTRQLKVSVNKANAAIDAAASAAENGDKAVAAIQNETLPELNQLLRDIRKTSDSLRKVTDRVDRDGLGGVVGSPKLPDYEP